MILKKIIGIIIVFLSMQLAFAQAWKLNEGQSHIKFNIRNAGLNVEGEFHEFDAKIDFIPENPEKSSFYGEIKVASIDTGIGMRDRDLQKEKYFHEAKYPEITFQSTKVNSKKSNVITVTGQLTIKGTQKQISFDVNYAEESNKVVFTFSLPLNRRDFGVGGSSWLLSDDFKANLQITTAKK
ncbi:MAG: YceI family protein [Anditalea sp.]